jgi:hypothetical protein
MRLSARLAAGKLTLLSRSSAASRTTDSGYFSWAGVLFHGEKWKRSTSIFKSSVRQRTPYSWAGAQSQAGLRRGQCGMSTACHGVGAEWPASEFASKRSGATQRPRREEHAAPPAGNPAVAVVGRRYRQKSLLTLRRVKHSEGGRRCLFNIAHFEPAQQRTHCITFVAIRSMLFSDSERLHLQREIFTMICTVRCKSLCPQANHCTSP